MFYYPIFIFEKAYTDLFSVISNTKYQQLINFIYTTSFLSLVYIILHMLFIYPNLLVPSVYNILPMLFI
jgi:hypothetical protein